MTNSKRFLDAFNQIEGLLFHDVDGGREIGFAGAVRASRNPIVRRYERDLREYAELRNAIVHAGTGRVLAEPNDGAVEDIEHVAGLLAAPPRVDQVIRGRAVTTTRPDVSIREPVLAMLNGDFSQIPVYGDKAFIALLTAETVSRWVGDSLQRDGGILDDTLVSDVLPHAEHDDNSSFLGPTATVFDALSLFEEFRRKGRTLDAIIVAQDARRDVKPLNIVTIYDVPSLLKAT
ncbi:MAG TPA: hypothetical protein VIK08_00020 [Candidatus Limnocylindrales bacterium]